MMRKWEICLCLILATALLPPYTLAQELEPGTSIMIICEQGARGQSVEDDKEFTIDHGSVRRVEETAPNRYVVRHQGKGVYVEQDDVKTLDAALVWVDQQIEQNPNAEHYALRTHILYNLGQMQQAIEASDKALDLDPENIRAMQYRAAACFFSNQLSEAEKTVDRLLELAPDDYLTQINAYYVANGRQDWEAARAALEKSVELNPWNGPLWANLANFQFWNGERETGFASLKQAMQVDPTYAVAWGTYGVRLHEDGDRQALKYLTRAVELNIKEYATYRVLLELLEDADDHQLYRQALIQGSRCKDCPETMRRRHAWRLATSPTEARRDGDAALLIISALFEAGQTEPEVMALCLKTKAAALAELERFDEALETLDLINPDSHDPQFRNMQQAFQQQDKFRDDRVPGTHDL